MQGTRTWRDTKGSLVSYAMNLERLNSTLNRVPASWRKRFRSCSVKKRGSCFAAGGGPQGCGAEGVGAEPPSGPVLRPARPRLPEHLQQKN